MHWLKEQFQFFIDLPPLYCAVLMVAGVVVFFLSSSGIKQERKMSKLHVASMVGAVILFFLGLFPFVVRLPQYLPSLQ